MMNLNKIRTALNILFMIIALIAVIVYFTVSDSKVFMYICGVAVCVKIAEFFLRFTHK